MNHVPVHLRIHADLPLGNGDGDNVRAYRLYNSLATKIPTHIYECMTYYCESYIFAFRKDLDRESVLDIKEKIDDYLEDVQFRVIGKLDDSSVSRLTAYTNMDLVAMIDKINSIPVNERINQLIEQHG